MKKITDECLRNEIARISKSIFKLNALQRCRLPEIVYQRQSIMYILKVDYHYTLSDIGFKLCLEKPYAHCSVIHSINIVKSELGEQGEFIRQHYESRYENILQWRAIIKSIFNINDSDQKEIRLLNKLIDMLPKDESDMIREIKIKLGY